MGAGWAELAKLQGWAGPSGLGRAGQGLQKGPRCSRRRRAADAGGHAAPQRARHNWGKQAALEATPTILDLEATPTPHSCRGRHCSPLHVLAAARAACRRYWGGLGMGLLSDDLRNLTETRHLFNEVDNNESWVQRVHEGPYVLKHNVTYYLVYR